MFVILLVVGTVLVRIAIFPLVILAQRNAAEMANHMPTMNRLQLRITEARRTGDASDGLFAFVFCSLTHRIFCLSVVRGDRFRVAFVILIYCVVLSYLSSALFVFSCSHTLYFQMCNIF